MIRNQEDLLLYGATQGFLQGRPMQMCWADQGETIFFLRSSPDSKLIRLYEYTCLTKALCEILTPEQLLQGHAEELSTEEKARRERLRMSAQGFTSFSLSADNRFILLPFSSRLFLFDRAKKQTSEIPAELPILASQFSPDGTKIAFVQGRDVFVWDLITKTRTQITHSASESTQYGVAEFVAQEEMHRFSGLFWAPDGTKLAICEVDNQAVQLWHMGNLLHPEQPAVAFPYPRTGTANAQVRLGLFPVQGGAATWVTWDQNEFPYLASVCWPQHASLTLVVQNRCQKDIHVLQADEITGQTNILWAEHDETWLNLDQSVPRYARNSQCWLWSTEKNGSYELESRDCKGNFSGIVVPKELKYHSLLAVDEERGLIWVASCPNPTERHVYQVSLANGATKKMTHEAGIHHAIPLLGQTKWIHLYSSMDALPQCAIRQEHTPFAEVLPAVETEPTWDVQVEFVQTGAQQFHAALVRPAGFVKNKKYPVILDIYAGPCHIHVQRIKRRWLLNQWLANQGFVVVAVDGRGTPGRGHLWERGIHQDFSKIPLQDQIDALASLGQAHPELDLSRVGISGWSFGGYMAALGVLKRPDVFKAAVAGAPVVDWEYYDTHYTERYLGLPAENAVGYTNSNLQTYAESLSRPLLLLHGTADDNVYFMHTLKLSQTLLQAGKHHEFLPFVGATHMLSDPILHQRKWETIAAFFARTL